jgi:hypothetical protein
MSSYCICPFRAVHGKNSQQESNMGARETSSRGGGKTQQFAVALRDKEIFTTPL